MIRYLLVLLVLIAFHDSFVLRPKQNSVTVVQPAELSATTTGEAIMTEHKDHKPQHAVGTAIGEAVHNVEQAHADDLAGKGHGGAPAAGEAEPDHKSTVDVEKDGNVHVETGKVATDADDADKDED